MRGMGLHLGSVGRTRQSRPVSEGAGRLGERGRGGEGGRGLTDQRGMKTAESYLVKKKMKQTIAEIQTPGGLWS